MNASRPLLAASLLFLPLLAQAHPGHQEGTGFAAGALHSFTGWDHMLALAVAGVLLGLLWGRMRWLVGVSFVALVALGHAWWVQPDAAGAAFTLGLLLANALVLALGSALTHGLMRRRAARTRA